MNHDDIIKQGTKVYSRPRLMDDRNMHRSEEHTSELQSPA